MRNFNSLIRVFLRHCHLFLGVALFFFTFFSQCFRGFQQVLRK